MLLPRCCLPFLFWAITAQAQQVFINELHYDNNGSDTGEGFEIAGTAGTDLSEYDVLFYNGSGGAIYGSPLALTGTIPNQSGLGAGAVWFAVAGIQNGSPDGLVLYHRPSSTIVQRISYEGAFTAAGGVADGLSLPDIGVAEDGNTPEGQSLQLTGSGSSLTQFAWTGPHLASHGQLNAGQTWTGAPLRTAAMALLPGLLTEGGVATLHLQLIPPPPAPVTYSLLAVTEGVLSLPPQITVPAEGTATVQVTALTDGVADGFQEVVILAQPPDASWPVAAAGAHVIDANRPQVSAPGALRLMSFNARLGAGMPGSAEFNAAREVVERISPDVLVMQEVHSANGFADFLSLAQQAGFPVDAAHVSLRGDAFAAQPYLVGDIAGTLDQSVVAVSRYPVKQRIQCGRGSGRVEITRFPLLTDIDVPWLTDAQDPVIINVHLKSDSGDASNFRRALEALRLRQVITAAGFDTITGNVIVTGDFNATDTAAQPVSYQTSIPAVQSPGTGQFADGTTLPQSFNGGSDLTNPGFTLPYQTFPHSGFNPMGLTGLSLKQADGTTEYTFANSAFKFDYFFVSAPIAARGVQTEIYNSQLEAFHDGLPKRSTLPSPGLSTTASDHFAIFADVPLIPQPSLRVSFSRASVVEGESGLTATISAVPAPSTPVFVSLSAWRDGRISVPLDTVTLSAAQPSVVVPVTVPVWSTVELHRRVALTASAPGYYSGTGSVAVQNVDAAGLLVISQYSEPATGSAPRAIELYNASGEIIDFAVTRLKVLRYSNGNTDGITDAEVTAGTVPPGAVMVIGDDLTGDHMVSQGLIPPPATPFASQPEHTVSFNGAGHAAFVLDHLVFTGNDAMEVLIDDARSDVFGDIGHDPGNAWTGPGSESSANGLLTLRPEVATGSSGWRQPGRRFTFAAASLNGFGVAPVITDPYITWTGAAGLSGIAAAPGSDPDHDGASNLLEYAFVTSPVGSSSFPALTPHSTGFTRCLRTNDASLVYAVQSSTSFSSWQAAAGNETSGPAFPDGTVERTFALPAGTSTPLFLRQRVSRP